MIEFCNNDVHISENGIDLLRNQFPYRHFDYTEISTTKIGNGYLLKNRWLILITGVVFVIFSLKLLVPGLAILIDFSNSFAALNGEALAMKLFIPLCLIASGSYVIALSLRKSKIFPLKPSY